MKLREALAAAVGKLSSVSDTPRLDAELLAAHALGTTRNDLLLKHLEGSAPEGFDSLVARRLTSEPIAYITERRDFWTLSLAVRPGVLIPRPDSETLIEAALAHFVDRQPQSILDLGTGSGALLLAALMEFSGAKGLGIDQARDAITIAEENAVTCQLASRAEFRLGNWAEGLRGSFDLILCNPPYIRTDADLPEAVVAFEPSGALFAGPEGLDDYRVLAPQIARLLAPSGCAVMEIGFDQAVSVGTMFEGAGLSVEVWKDLGGRDRCLRLTKSL